MHHARSVSLWISAAILVCLPALVAIDFGGVLRWTQYAAAFAILIAFVFATAGLFDSSASTGLSQHKLLIPIALFVGVMWLQTREMSPTAVGLFSGGSRDAYVQWTDGLLPEGTAWDSFSISISPFDTAHVAAFMTVMAALVFAGSLAFHSRSRLVLLLSAIALAGFSVAVVGVFRKLSPDADWWFIQDKSSAFAGFVNRNNAALMLNLGLAASLGLLSWRMVVLHSIEFDDPDFEFNDLVALISDRDSFIGIISAAGCVSGLLINGSRGGIVAALVGILFAFGYVRPRRGKISFPVLILVIAASVAVLVVPLDLKLESIARFQFFSEEANTIQNDGRLQHWQDGIRAAWAYFPLGSGVGTYRFAYLPFQDQSPGAWFDHADNLWLEILVEAGLIGILCVLLMFLMVMISLRRLGESVDALDQGVRVAGWYAIGCVFTSQFFDFGLLMPANLIAVLLLACAVVSRDLANGGAAIWRYQTGDSRTVTEFSQKVNASISEPSEGSAATVTQTDFDELSEMESQSEPKRLGTVTVPIWRRRPRWWGHVRRLNAAIVAGVIFLVAAPQVSVLRSNAEVESFTRRVDGSYPDLAYNLEGLQSVRQRLGDFLTTSQDPTLATQLATVSRDLGRLQETLEWKPATLNEAVEVYRNVDLDNRKLPYPPTTSRKRRESIPSQQSYLDAKIAAVDSLRMSPLNQSARAMLVQLQPVLLGLAEAPVAVRHLIAFYATEPRRLMLLGRRALDNGQVDQARIAYRQSLEVAPRLTRQVMPVFLEDTPLSPIEVIPSDPSAMKTAAATVLQWDRPDEAFLLKAVQQIDCDDDESLENRASCHALKADIYRQLEQVEPMFENLKTAIRFEPTRAEFRITLIEQLFAAQRTKEALRQARIGRQLIDDDRRFQAWIDKIAAFDRKLAPLEGDDNVEFEALPGVMETLNLEVE